MTQMNKETGSSVNFDKLKNFIFIIKGSQSLQITVKYSSSFPVMISTYIVKAKHILTNAIQGCKITKLFRCQTLYVGSTF